MANNQEEKIKLLIKKTGRKVEEAIEILEISKQTFYNNIRKIPISADFKDKLEKKLGIKLDEKSINIEDEDENEILKKKIEQANQRIIELQNEIIQLLKKKGD